MSRLERLLRLAHQDLGELQAPWALIGGLAVSVRTEPRFTRDIDLAVAVADDGAAECLIGDLAARGYAVAETVEQEATGRLATARLLATDEPAEGAVIDLMFASSGVEPEIQQQATELEVFPGLLVPVALTGHLIALKLLSRDDATRPQDATDLVALLAIAAGDDLALAAATVRLIEERGYARGRDLSAALKAGLRPRGR